MNNSISIIAKTVLLWLTAIIIMLSICSADSLMSKGYIWFFGVVILNITLILICISRISEDEIYKISGYNWLNEIIDKDK